jgi:zinc and cadmium transporter
VTGLPQVVLLTGFGGVLSAVAASVFVLLGERARTALIPPLVAFATGALLAAACLGLLPEAFAAAGPAGARGVGLAAVLGLVAFFLLEKVLRVRAAARPRGTITGPLILWGDALHNAVDGAAIAGAYLTAPTLAVATAIAVFAHELPREIGDLAVLLDAGMPRRRALALNLLASLAAVAGAVVSFYALRQALTLLPFALALAGGTLLYVALAALVPGLQGRGGLRVAVGQLLAILAGVGAVWLTETWPGI